MIYNNINLWFAKDTNGKIITIYKVNKELKNTYYCPLCGSEVIARQGDIMSWHFAHIDKSKCDSESMVHFWIKNKLLKVGDCFKIKTDENLEFVVKDILIEQKYKVSDKIYSPDITVITECGKTIYFEVANTNKKKVEEYLDTWIELGNIIVEVDSKDLINSQNEDKLEFKALYYYGKYLDEINKEDKECRDIINEYKEQLKKQGIYEEKKEEVKKLDWFLIDLNKYLLNKIDISELSNEIQSVDNIKSREIIVNIMRKNKCTKAMKDYIEYNKQKLEQKLKNNYDKFNYVLSKERLVYDRIYKGFKICLYYNNSFIYSGEIEMNCCNIGMNIENKIKIYRIMSELKEELEEYLKNEYEIYIKEYYGNSYLFVYNTLTKETIYKIKEGEKCDINDVKVKVIDSIDKNKQKILFEKLKNDIVDNLVKSGFDIIIGKNYWSSGEYITFDIKYKDLKYIDIKISKDKNLQDNIKDIIKEYIYRKDRLIYLYDILKEYECKVKSIKNGYEIYNLNNEISIRYKDEYCFEKKYEEILSIEEILTNEVLRKCLIEDLDDYKDYKLLKYLNNLIYERFKKVEDINTDIYFYTHIDIEDRILKVTRRDCRSNRKDIVISETIPNDIYDVKEIFDCVMNKVSDKLRLEISNKRRNNI